MAERHHPSGRVLAVATNLGMQRWMAATVMPRLSVDIEFVVVCHDPARESALKAIGIELASAQQRVASLWYQAELGKHKEGTEAKLFLGCAEEEVEVHQSSGLFQQLASPTLAVRKTPWLLGDALPALPHGRGGKGGEGPVPRFIESAWTIWLARQAV